MSNITVPILPTDNTWRLLNKDQVYTGPDGKGNLVPNVGDTLMSTSSGIILYYEVLSVDLVTGLSEVMLLTVGNEDQSGGGSGIGATVETSLGGVNGFIESYRCFIDTSVVPHTLTMDFRLKTHGTETMYMKVILGSDVEKGEVISRMYDHTGSFISQNIPLELVTMEKDTNVCVKRPLVGYSSKSLNNGELVTAVFYTEEGRVVRIQQMLVRNSTWIRTLNDKVKYIESIRLESPFMSEGDDRVLDIPINIPTSNIPLRGVVKYNDGEEIVLPVDGTKFALFGLNRFVSSKLGNRQPLSLVYYLSRGEIGYGSVNNDIMQINERYYAQTTHVVGAYTLRIFTYPKWVDSISGYELKHYLYSLDRDTWYDVSDKVTAAVNSPGYNPLAYGVEQHLTFALDLTKVDANRYKAYTHIQNTIVTLRYEADDTRTSWTVGHLADMPHYGADISAKAEYVNTNLTKLDITANKTSLSTWLAATFHRMYAIYNSQAETQAPEPNYMLVRVGNWEIVCPVEMWNTIFTVPKSVTEKDLVTIHFIKRTNNTDLQLGVVAMLPKRTN